MHVLADIERGITHGKNQLRQPRGDEFLLPNVALDQAASWTAHLLCKSEYKLVRSWAKFVCRAATECIDNIWELLPRYTSLAQPPAATMDYLEYLVATIQSLIGPLPVTDRSLQQQPESYLPWLHLVLLDFHAVQGAPHAPKLFTMLPQSSNHTHFITISSTSLHK